MIQEFILEELDCYTCEMKIGANIIRGKVPDNGREYLSRESIYELIKKRITSN